MHLYVESLCHAGIVAETRLAGAHLLSGIALALLSGRLWLICILCVLEPLFLGALGEAERWPLALYALAGAFFGAWQRYSVLRWRDRDLKSALPRWRHLPWLVLLPLAALYRVAEHVCETAFPLGAVRSLALYLGAALLVENVLAERGAPSLLRPHLTDVASIYAIFSASRLWTPALAAAALAASAVLSHVTM